MKKNTKHNLIIINQESYLSSLMKDLTSLSLLAFFCWFNYNFIGNSYFVNFLIICMIFAYILNIAKSELKEVSSYHGVSSAKINKIKEILEND